MIGDEIGVAPILIDPFEVTGGQLDIAPFWEMNEKSEMRIKREKHTRVLARFIVIGLLPVFQA